MDEKEKILDFLRTNGPAVPTMIGKQIERDSFFTTAHLSELKEIGKVKISNLKVGGGSPLYYLPGQETKLQNFSIYLGEKEKMIYELLKDKRVLMDATLVPVFRAAIRTIKDFASPFAVDFNGKREIFWKWYLLPNEQAGEIIKSMLGIKRETENKEDKIEDKIIEQRIVQKAETIKDKPLQQIKLQQDVQIKREDKQEREERQESIRQECGKQQEKKKGDFHSEVKDYFNRNNIKVIEENASRRASEIDFIVELPSPVGDLRYYVKAKSKKKVNESDLNSVFVQSQSKRLPVLFLTKGSLTKKAKEMLESEFRGIKFNKI